jgi:hypothetical protein
MAEINKATQSVQHLVNQQYLVNQMVNQKRNQQENSKLEMKGIQISQETVGDGQAQSRTSDLTTKSFTEAVTQDTERADNIFDHTISGKVAESSSDKKKAKEIEEKNSEAFTQALNQTLIADIWNNVGGAEGKVS